MGQSFLVDQRVVRDLVEAVEPTRPDLVLEVGAGTGTVTKELANQAGKVLAVEFDHDLIPILRENLKSFDNVEIINKDILAYRIPHTASRLKIVGSIPYQITSPLIHKLIETEEWLVAALLIQKEVAEKITARPPKATYLSNFISAFANVNIVRNISKTAFKPQPKVDGTIIKIKRSSKPYTIDPKPFSDFLHRGFSHPRKMLKNIFPEERLKNAGIDPQARAQELTLTNWLGLFELEDVREHAGRVPTK